MFFTLKNGKWFRVLLQFFLQHPGRAYCISSVASHNGISWQEASEEQEIVSLRLRSSQIEQRLYTEYLSSSVYQTFTVFYLLYH